jgi:SHS2 domain-containing protein
MVIFRPPQEGISIGEHTADIWLEASARDLEGLIYRTIMGIYGVMATAYELDGAFVDREISVEGPDLETAFIDVLSEILFLFDAESFVFTQTVSITEFISEGYVKIEILGRGGNATIPSGCAGMEVKAVTYHGATIVRERGNNTSKVLLDI